MRLKKGLLYVLSANILTLMISTITGFLLPKMLSIDTYANIKLFQLYVTYTGILNLGYAEGMYLKIGGKDLKQISQKELLSEIKTLKIFQIIVSILIILVTLISKQYILFFCALVIFPINISNYFKQLYQATGNFDKYSKFANINTILLFLANMTLIFILRMDNYVIFIGSYIIVYFLNWIILELEIAKLLNANNIKNKVKLNIKALYNNIKEGFLLMLGNFGTAIFTSIDKLFVQNLLGLTQFAYYSFAVSLENLLNAFIAPISVVMYNYFCNSSKEKILFIKRCILVFASAIIILAFPVKFLVEHWMPKYQNSLSILFLLFAAQYFSVIVKCIYNNLYKANKKQNKYFIIMAIMIVISILLNIIGFSIKTVIESFAFATLITNIIWLIINECQFKEYRYSWKQLLYISIVIISFEICGLINNTIIGFVIYGIIYILSTMIFMTNEYKYFLKQIKNVINKLIRRKKKMKKSKIAVAGTGYVGLVAGVCFAEKGQNVVCVDIDENKINKMKKGISPIYEQDLEELMQKNYKEGRLDYTTDYQTAYKDADFIFIGVGTPERKDGSANLDYVFAVAKQIAESIEKDCIVVVKSTVPIGTNDEVEKYIKQNLKNNVKVEVASNPEFLAQGTAVRDTLQASRIVIGTESKYAEEKLLDLYKNFNLPIVSTNRRSAEMIKYASNDFLALKISYINDIANLCEVVGANIEDVAKGMSFDARIGNKFLKAGCGYGGSCFPKDTKALHYLAEQGGYELKTVKAAIEVNKNQKLILLKKARNKFKSFKDVNVAILGLTFKPGTDDLREAPSLDNIAILLEEGANIKAYDPIGIENYKKIYPNEIEYTKTPQEALKNADICFIFTEWDEIKNIKIEDYKKLMKNPLVYDGRNIYSLVDMKDIEYYSIGR